MSENDYSIKIEKELKTEILNHLNLIKFRKVNKLIKIKKDLNFLSTGDRNKLVKKLGITFHTHFTYSHITKELIEKDFYIISKTPGNVRHYTFYNDDKEENDLQVINYEGNIETYKYMESLNTFDFIQKEKYYNVMKLLLKKENRLIFQDNNFRIIKIYEKM